MLLTWVGLLQGTVGDALEFKWVSACLLPGIAWKWGRKKWFFVWSWHLATLWTLIDQVINSAGNVGPPYGWLCLKATVLNPLVSLVQLLKSLCLHSFWNDNSSPIQKELIINSQLSSSFSEGFSCWVCEVLVGPTPMAIFMMVQQVGSECCALQYISNHSALAGSWVTCVTISISVSFSSSVRHKGGCESVCCVRFFPWNVMDGVHEVVHVKSKPEEMW